MCVYPLIMQLAQKLTVYHEVFSSVELVMIIFTAVSTDEVHKPFLPQINPLNPELNPICYLLALLAHHFLHVNRIRVKSLTIRLLMSHIYIYVYIYGAPILDVSRSYITTHHSR